MATVTRRAGRRRAAAIPALDLGPAERGRHDVLAVEPVPREEGGGRRGRVVTQRPLDRYLQRREIDRDQFDAGERLRRDFERAGLMPRVTMHYAPRLPRAGGSGEPGDHRLDARERLYGALDAVGRLGEGVLWHVCCLDEAAGDWAHRHGRPPREGIVLLRAALAELVLFYRPELRRPQAA